MAQPDGRVYHPEYGQAIADDAAKRRELVRQLKQNADRANSDGDACLRTADYDRANELWRYAARCMRSMQSISGGKPTDSEDWPLIGRAWLSVQHGDRSVHDWVDQTLKEV